MSQIESKLRGLFDAPIAVVLPEIVKASLAAHAIEPTLHKVLHEQVPRLSGTESENLMIELLRTYLTQQCDHIPPQNLDYLIFIIKRTIEALTHAAVIERSDLLNDGQLEQEISEMLVSYLTQKLVHLDLAPAFLLRFRPAREWNSGLALRSPLKRTEYLKPSCSPFSGLRTVRP